MVATGSFCDLVCWAFVKGTKISISRGSANSNFVFIVFKLMDYLRWITIIGPMG
jgi:hypothetical protein